jgi:predicted enzyme related to lactoylglutathione lyase
MTIAHCRLAALFLVGSSLSSIVPAAALTPLVEPASQEHHVGKVIFVELVTPDLAGAKRFYGGLFGWTFRDVAIGETEYAEASLNGRPVAGIARRDLPAAERRQPAWLNFMATSDVDAVSKTALQGGAKLLSAPHTVPGRGREAVFADPQGAVFAALSSSSGDPPDLLAAPGEWIWSSLITTDPETDAAFYQTLFDYEVFDLPAGPGAQHLMLASESFARASASTLPEDRPMARAHWLSYVRVVDMDASVAKLAALGGRVLVEPRVDRHGGRVAVVADPSGAAFGLLEWKAGDSMEVGE